MLKQEAVDAFNARLRVDPNSIKKMSASQLDAVKVWGSKAENLLTNKDLAQFIHEYKFDLTDQLADIIGHDPESNARRIAIANKIAGVDDFINVLKRATYYKNTAVSQQNAGPANTESKT